MSYDPTPAYGQEQRRSGPRWYSVVAFLVIAGLLFLNAAAMLGNLEANERIADTNDRIERLTSISTCMTTLGAVTGDSDRAQLLRTTLMGNCMDDEKRAKTPMADFDG